MTKDIQRIKKDWTREHEKESEKIRYEWYKQERQKIIDSFRYKDFIYKDKEEYLKEEQRSIKRGLIKFILMFIYFFIMPYLLIHLYIQIAAIVKHYCVFGYNCLP